MSTCSPSDLRIGVFHLLSSPEEKVLEIKNEFCLVPQKIPYKIAYYATKKIDLTLFETISGECDFILIYSQSDIPIIDFLKIKKDFSKTTIYNAHPLYTFLTNPSFKGRKITNNDLEKLGVKGVQVYNLMPSKKLTYVVRKSMSNELMVSLESVKETKFLECQFWFEIFITKSFGCGFGKLFQLSGTCYINAPLNGFLLSEGIRLLLLFYYHSSSKKFDNLLDPFEFLMSLTQKIFFTSDRPRVKESLKSSTDLLKKIGDDVFQNAEDSSFVLFKFLKSLVSNFVINFQDGSFSSCPSSSLTNETFERFLEEERFSFDGQTPIVVQMFDEQTEIPKEKTFFGTKFLLQFGIIRIEVDEYLGHVVVGFFCNSIPMIYNSNHQTLIMDWTKLVAKENGFVKNAVYMSEKMINRLKSMNFHEADTFSLWLNERFH